MKLAYKLLSRRVTPWQLAGFFLSNLLGMCIVLGSAQFYEDVIPLFAQGDSFMQKQYVVVAKPVNALKALAGKDTGFAPQEVERLRQQGFAQSVGEFTPAGFEVYASVSAPGSGLSMGTEMFFEAIPDAYVDVASDLWHYVPGNDTLPVILPRNYLNLYNFGFARSRQLPLITEGMASMARIRFALRGERGAMGMEGRIAGFSNRLNTILVPQSFMDWANARLGTRKETQPARLIVEVDNPADDRLARFLQDNGYETENNGDDAGKTVYFLRITTAIVLGVGLVISLLAFYVLLLSIFILLQKHTERMDTLLLMGHSPTSVAMPFHTLSLSLNALVLALSFVAVALLRSFYLPVFTELYPSFSAGPPRSAPLLGALLFGATALLNFVAIRHKVMAVWNLHKEKAAQQK